MKIALPARRLVVAASALTLSTSLAACGALSNNAESGSSSSAAASDGRPTVATSFYPITYLAQQIAGEHMHVTSVTPTNVEPHDFELSPKDVTDLGKASAVLYVSGFQPSLDDALSQVSGPAVTDLASAVKLTDTSSATSGESEDHDHDGDGEQDHATKDHDHAHDAASTSASANASTSASAETAKSDHDHEHGSLDPHFWLDPTRMKATATAVAEALAKVDPERASEYQQKAEALGSELDSLDESYSAGTQQCERRTFVTSHAAFGYLAQRYNLTQASVSGLDPEAEPSPAKIAEIRELVRNTGTTTIFTEELVSPATAEALAAETGTSTAVLSTLESQPAEGDYTSAMRANLDALRTALACS